MIPPVPIPPPKKIQHMIIRVGNPNAFQEQVNELLKQGWTVVPDTFTIKTPRHSADTFAIVLETYQP
jgi:hypothetical protein